MKYYTLNPDSLDKYGDVDAPVDELGTPIESGKGPTSAKRAFTEAVDKRHQFGDCIHSIGGVLIVSQNAAKEFSSFKYENGASQIPTRINLGRRGGSIDGPLSIVFPMHHDFVDIERSKFKTLANIRISATSPIFLTSNLPLYDVQSVLYLQRWVCSERVIESIEKHGFTNFKYEEIPTAD